MFIENFDIIFTMKKGWYILYLLRKAFAWFKRMRKQKKTAGDKSSWWHLAANWCARLPLWLKDFKHGSYQFSPLMQYQFKNEIVQVWSYLDRLMLHLILGIITPTFKRVISELCCHLSGPSTIKYVTADIIAALKSGRFNYCLRLDIKRYYATINHKILLKQLHENYADPILLRHFTDIVTIGVDCGGQVVLPKTGIPIRSALSPFFGAMYLTPLDKAFARRPTVFYRRYMDDIIILVENKRQYAKARKLVFKILQELKLTLSPSKSWMGLLKNGFHYLGVHFGVARTPQGKIQMTTIDVHPRTCRRVYDKAALLQQNAGHPATIQRYLSHWAIWWKSKIRLRKVDLIYKWVCFTADRNKDMVWYGRGLLLNTAEYYLSLALPSFSNQNQEIAVKS